MTNKPEGKGSRAKQLLAFNFLTALISVVFLLIVAVAVKEESLITSLLFAVTALGIAVISIRDFVKYRR